MYEKKVSTRANVLRLNVTEKHHNESIRRRRASMKLILITLSLLSWMNESNLATLKVLQLNVVPTIYAMSDMYNMPMT